MTSSKIYEKLALITGDLSKVGMAKNKTNKMQGYQFRGIDDVYQAISPLFSEYGVVCFPETLSRESIERQTKNGGAIFYTTLRIKYTFVCAEDGSRHDVIVYGEAMDSADKSTNKAMSAAYKYCMIQTFCIPVEGDQDADAVTHEVVHKKQSDSYTPEQYSQIVDLYSALQEKQLVANLESSEPDKILSVKKLINNKITTGEDKAKAMIAWLNSCL